MAKYKKIIKKEHLSADEFKAWRKKIKDMGGVEIGASKTTTVTLNGKKIASIDQAIDEAFGRTNSSKGNSNKGNSNSNVPKGYQVSDGSSSSNVSPLLQGEMTFEELVGEITKGIDLIFATKRGVIVITDYESIFAEAQYLRDKKSKAVESEDIKMWQLEEGTYELDVAEYGFYNTVKVHYKGGVIEESYEDLVRVYGTVAIDYYEKDIDKTTAQYKAKAYLAAHVRDFEMSVKANILWDGDIDIGDIVTIENPLTMRDDTRKSEGRLPEYYFVLGKSLSWDEGDPIIGSLELRYSPVSPEQKEVPAVGNSYSDSGASSQASSSEIEKAVKEVGKKWHGIRYSGECQTYSCVQKTHAGDCWGCSDTIACELIARGVTCRIKNYVTSSSDNHRSVQYKNAAGKWVNFPYREFGFNQSFNDTSGVNGAREVKCTCKNNN